MKTFSKRAISILLSVIMVLSVFTVIPLTASAADSVETLSTGAQVKSNTTGAAARNTWAFFGGRDVQGTYAEAGGSRNYVRHFEEAVRRQNDTGYGTGDNVKMTRFIANLGATGESIAEVVATLDADLNEVDPQTSVYMVCREDYEKGNAGLAAFKADLKTFIDKALANRSNTGRVVIQNAYTPNDASQVENAKAYSNAVNEVVKAHANNARILVVNHNAQTETGFSDKINERGYLNASGQLAIAKQLVSALGLSYNITDAYIQKKVRSEAPSGTAKAEIIATVGADNALTITSKDF